MAIAQMANIQANTEKTKAETANIEGGEKEKLDAEVLNLKQDIENKKAQEALTRVENTLKDFEAKIAGKTYEEQIDILKWTAKKAETDYRIAVAEEYVARNTQTTQVQSITVDIALKKIQIEATKAGIQLNKAQISKWQQEILQGWKGLDQNGKKLRIDAFKAKIEANYPSIGNVTGKIIDKVNAIGNNDNKRGQSMDLIIEEIIEEK